MDIQIQKKHYLIPRKYWGWIAGGIVLVGVLVALGLTNFSATLRVERKGLNISEVKRDRFNDYVSGCRHSCDAATQQVAYKDRGKRREEA